MKQLRTLIYEEKNLTYWDFDTQDTLYTAIVNELLQTEGFRARDNDMEETLTKILNDASFLCTLTVDYFKRPYLHIGDFRKYVTGPIYNNPGLSRSISEANAKINIYATIVLIVTWCLLSHIKDYKTNIKIDRTVAELDSTLKDYSNYSNITFESFYYATVNIKQYLPIETFTRRKLGTNFLDKIDWKQITSEYDIEKIQRIVRLVPKENDTRRMIINAIESFVTREYNSEPIHEDDELPF